MALPGPACGSWYCLNSECNTPDGVAVDVGALESLDPRKAHGTSSENSRAVIRIDFKFGDHDFVAQFKLPRGERLTDVVTEAEGNRSVSPLRLGTECNLAVRSVRDPADCEKRVQEFVLSMRRNVDPWHLDRSARHSPRGLPCEARWDNDLRRRARLAVSDAAQEAEAFDSWLPDLPILAYCHTNAYTHGLGLNIRETPDLARLAEYILRFPFDSAVDPLSSAPEKVTRKILGMPQVSALFYYLSGRSHIDDKGREPKVKPDKLLSFVFKPNEQRYGLKLARKDVGSLSSGQVQLLFLCFLLVAMRPSNFVLLIDEPELHLSPVAVTRLQHALLACARYRGNQIVIASHHSRLICDGEGCASLLPFIHTQGESGGPGEREGPVTHTYQLEGLDGNSQAISFEEATASEVKSFFEQWTDV